MDLAGREVGGQAVGGERAWFLEPELALVLRDEVCGPGVTPERIRQSVAGVAAAFELVRPRRGWEDRDLQRAVNGSTAGHVLGPLLPGCPSAEDMDALVIETHANDEVFGPVRGGDVNDNPLSSVAWLANYFAQFEVPLAAGSVLLTGTYSGLLPMRAGQHWRTTISGLEPVELMTR